MDSSSQNFHPITSTLPQVSGRMSTRVAAILPIELILEGSHRNTLPARAVDIGTGGVCVRTASPIDGALVRQIRFKLDRHDLEFMVSCKWSSPVGSSAGPLSGFVFEHVDARSEAALWSFIQARAMDIATFLRTCGGLTELTFQDAIELALATRIRELESGQIVYGGAESEPCGSIFALFRGNVMIERKAKRRNQQATPMESGELFGGLPTIAGCEPLERAVATSDSTLLEFIDYNTGYLLTYKPTLGSALVRAATFHWVKRATQLLDQASAQAYNG